MQHRLAFILAVIVCSGCGGLRASFKFETGAATNANSTTSETAIPTPSPSPVPVARM